LLANELKMELTKHQQQYRLMEGDRKAYCEETQNSIRKQKTSIEQLKREEQELIKELNLAKSVQNKLKDKGTVDKLKNLKDKEAEYIQQIESEKEKIKDFDAQIRKMEKSIRDQHKNM